MSLFKAYFKRQCLPPLLSTPLKLQYEARRSKAASSIARCGAFDLASIRPGNARCLIAVATKADNLTDNRIHEPVRAAAGRGG